MLVLQSGWFGEAIISVLLKESSSKGKKEGGRRLTEARNL